jgi:hypothetical protein
MRSLRRQLSIPRYIEERIRRRHPRGLCVVPGSTPVLAFGNCLTARVATLGLNPSRLEFLHRNGALREGPDRRLATHSSLGVSDLSRAPYEIIAQVFKDCANYFQAHPYCQWFRPLEEILAACGASYSTGSACHLDLVQWATDPTWGKIKNTAVRERLIADAPFLSNQLNNKNFRLLLVNGRARGPN